LKSKDWTLCVATFFATLLHSIAFAQEYPTRPVELVVPFAPGGASEFLARTLSDSLSKRLGQPFVVINRPGANTNIATASVVRAKPDGYSLLMATVGLTANPSLYRKLGFEPQRDLEPIMLLANSPAVLVVPRNLGVESLAAFITQAKANPGLWNYASYGAGSGPHLATELFASRTGVRLVHVPYGGGGPATVAVVSGQVQALFASILPVLGQIRSDKLKVLAIAAQARSELLPEVATFSELGIDYRTGSWFGVLAPAGTPAPIIRTLNRHMLAILNDPPVRAKVIAQGAELVASSPEDFRAFLKLETERLAAIIRAANIQLD
jgi:tripartite-type tricarboxylate transporter receptor subunit TctC